MARPEALTPDKRREIIALAHCGLSRRAIAGYVHCAPATIENTARRSPEFAEALRYTTSRFIMENMRSIQQQARHSWRAATWCLEHTQPHAFGRRDAAAVRPAQQESQLRRLREALVAAVPEELRGPLAEQARHVIDELRGEFPDPHGWDDDPVSPRPPGQDDDDAPSPESHDPLAGELVRRAPASDVPSPAPAADSSPAPAPDSPSTPSAPSAAPPPTVPSSADPDDRSLRYPATADWPPPLPDSPGVHGFAYDMQRAGQELDRSRTAREYREMPESRLKYDLLTRDIERILKTSSELTAINFYRAATGETLAGSRNAVEDIKALCEEDPLPGPPPRTTPLPPRTQSSAAQASPQSPPLSPPPDPGRVHTVPANPATGTPHTTTILLSLLFAFILGALLFVSPRGHAAPTALTQSAASTSIGALPESSPAMNAVVPAWRPGANGTTVRGILIPTHPSAINADVVNHNPSTPPTDCSTTPICPIPTLALPANAPPRRPTINPRTIK